MNNAQRFQAEAPTLETVGPPTSGKRARTWAWIFLLLSLWVFGIRTGCLAFVLSDSYAALVPFGSTNVLEFFEDPEIAAVLDDPELLMQPENASVLEMLEMLGQPKYAAALEQLMLLGQPEYTALMEDTSKMAGIFLYPVQLLGVAVIPALLAGIGLLRGGRREKWVIVGLLALSVAIMPVFLFVRGILLRSVLLYTLLYSLVLFPSVALGIALRRGALYWREEKVALYIGMAFVLDHVCSNLGYYSWMATENAAIYLGFEYTFFVGLLVAAAVLRLRLSGEDEAALPTVPHVYPPRFPQKVGILLVVHALFSSAINTVIYFDNMDDFHTPGYELFFYILAFFVMLAAVLLYYRRRWLAPAMVGMLLICFGQGLSLFGIESIPLAIAYNLVTMIGKMPPLILSMIVPVYYAVGTRRPGLACLGFAIPCGADFLLNLTQLTEKGIGGALPGNARQGVLLFVGLCIIGALFYLYVQFERTRTNTLREGIRESQRERRSTQETVDGLDLTSREKEVTSLLLAGDSQKMIAAKLDVSLSTVAFHIRNLYRKLNIQSKGELFALFLAAEPSDIA